jgi:hypothetical protein
MKEFIPMYVTQQLDSSVKKSVLIMFTERHTTKIVDGLQLKWSKSETEMFRK